MKTAAGMTLMGILSLPTLAIAHHGPVTNPGLYRTDELLEVEGEIVEVLWRNPHVRLRLDDGDDVWELELSPFPSFFSRLGVSEDNFPIGGRIRAAGYVSRRDESALGVVNLLLPNGEEFVESGRTARWDSEEQLDLSYRPATTADADPEAAAAARASEEGIFRVWAGKPSRRWTQYQHLLTEHARNLAAQFDPVTDNPELECRQGMPTTMFEPMPMQIVEDGEQILIRVEEYDVERVVHMGMNEAPEGTEASPLGYSVGHWDSDALVVSTTNVGWPLFDQTGTPQSEQVAYTERFEVVEGDVLQYTFSAVDPVMFTEPVVVELQREWAPGIAVEEYDCVTDWRANTD